MRMILPTGEDGADRAYPLDGLADFSRITLNEMIEMRRVTGLGLAEVTRGFGLLDKVIGLDGDAVMVAMSEHLELMEAYRALVWVARHRAGDRAPDGSALTADAAVDFPFRGLNVAPDPGDDLPDPTAPAADRPAGGRKPSTRGRSAKTSARK